MFLAALSVGVQEPEYLPTSLLLKNIYNHRSMPGGAYYGYGSSHQIYHGEERAGEKIERKDEALISDPVQWDCVSASMNGAETACPRLGVWGSKLGHAFGPGGVDASSSKHDGNRTQDNSHIKKEGSMINVPQIPGEPRIPIKRVTSVDLAPAGQARSHRKSTSLIRSIARNILDKKWAWTNDRHV